MTKNSKNPGRVVPSAKLHVEGTVGDKEMVAADPESGALREAANTAMTAIPIPRVLTSRP